jgi:hypothetical protein
MGYQIYTKNAFSMLIIIMFNLCVNSSEFQDCTSVPNCSICTTDQTKCL